MSDDARTLAEQFTADEIETLIRTTADLYASTGDPHDVLSERQHRLARLACNACAPHEQGDGH